MAIISFWCGDKKESGQTLSMAAIATQMCVEHNMRTLIVDATFDDDTLERCFWNVNKSKSFAKQLYGLKEYPEIPFDLKDRPDFGAADYETVRNVVESINNVFAFLIVKII